MYGERRLFLELQVFESQPELPILGTLRYLTYLTILALPHVAFLSFIVPANPLEYPDGRILGTAFLIR